MLFHESVFLFLFLPVVLGGYLALTRMAGSSLRIGFLTIASLVFYAWWDVRFLPLLVGSIAANYLLGMWLERAPGRTGHLVLVAGVAANLGLLGVFKYLDFGVGIVNAVAGTGLQPFRVVLPLAISFFTFLQIAFLVDCRRGETRVRDFPAYALFVTFFPHLLAGPLVHHSELMPQFRQKREPGQVWADLSVGSTLFVIGLFKKMVLATQMAEWSDRVFQAAQLGAPPTLLDGWVGALAFTFQIYFDFSGYSDMALGLSRMFGILLPVNFASPYKATSIIEFWRRWHMTLSRFLRDYLYFPLGGNRKGPIRRHLNLMIVMVLAGLWHGAAWTFVVWGALHGAMLVLNHLWQAASGGAAGGQHSPVRRWAARMLTFLAVVVAWVPFRAADADTAWGILSGMAGLNGVVVPIHHLGSAAAEVLTRLGVSFGSVAGYGGREQLAWLAGCLAWVWLLPNGQEILARHRPALEDRALVPARWLAWRPSVASGLAVGVLALWLMAQIIQGQAGEFIYFQF